MIAQLVGDSMAVAAIIPASSLRQSVIPREMLGRAASVFFVGAGASAVLGALSGGVLGSALGPRAALFLAVGGLVATPMIGVFSPLWRLEQIPASEPKSAGSGP